MSQLKIFSQISKVMAEIAPIEKTRQNEAQKYKFRGIDDVYQELHPLLVKHGVFCAPCVIDQKREERTNRNGTVLIYTILTVKFTFYADDGSSIDVVTVGEGMDSGDKSANKAMSGAQKYAFIQMFAIPTAEPKDSENESHNLGALSENHEVKNVTIAPVQKVSGSIPQPVESAVCPECGAKMLKSKFAPFGLYCPNKKNHKGNAA